MHFTKIFVLDLSLFLFVNRVILYVFFNFKLYILPPIIKLLLVFNSYSSVSHTHHLLQTHHLLPKVIPTIMETMVAQLPITDLMVQPLRLPTQTMDNKLLMFKPQMALIHLPNLVLIIIQTIPLPRNTTEVPDTMSIHIKVLMAVLPEQ
jgi:hypothetical protein